MPKPSLPEDYTVPEVWRPVSLGGKFGATNAPVAGAREVEALPRGKHALQLHSLGTPNGQKVTILLEELGLDYDAWRVPITDSKQFTTGFVELNPNSKIPAMYDRSGGETVRLFESGSILLHLADTHGRFIPGTDRPAARAECINWLMWQMGSAPFIGGGFGHFFVYAPLNDEYAINRYSMETKRLLDVVEKHLAEGDKSYLLGDEYTIADMAVFPWFRWIRHGYKHESGLTARAFLGLDDYVKVGAWLDRLEARKAVRRGLRVNGFESDPTAIKERHSKEDFKPEDY